MLKVMIVDDEVLARVGVKSLIPWHENDYELIGECDNGKSGLELAIQSNPDIIITDIKMPIMSGIELIKAAKEHGLKAKFIVLSSYDDFELVKEAMKEGALDYLLKLQLEPEQLIKVLDHIKDDISIKDHKNKPKSYDYEDIDLLKDKFLKNLLYGEYGEHEIQQYLKLYNIILPSKNLICLVLKVNNTNNIHKIEDNMFVKSITNIILEGIKNYGIGQVVYLEPECYSIICSITECDQQAQEYEVINRMTMSIQEFIRNSMNVSVSIGISRVYRGLKFVRQAYTEALEAIAKGESYIGSIISYQDINQLNPDEHTNQMDKMDENLNQLALVLKSNNSERIEESFNLLIDNLAQISLFSNKQLIGTSHIFLFIINDFIDKFKLDPKDIWGEDGNDYYKITNNSRGFDYSKWVSKVKVSVLKALSEEEKYLSIIVKAKQYVAANIDSNISLGSASHYLGLSSGYFSRLFSKEMGQGFNEYVTNEKINLAKELMLSTNYKIYEIANRLGYENAYYFSRVFKKVEGISPKEYKNNPRHKNVL